MAGLGSWASKLKVRRSARPEGASWGDMCRPSQTDCRESGNRMHQCPKHLAWNRGNCAQTGKLLLKPTSTINDESAYSSILDSIAQLSTCRLPSDIAKSLIHIT